MVPDRNVGTPPEPVEAPTKPRAKQRAQPAKHPIGHEEYLGSEVGIKSLMNEAARLESEVALLSRYRDQFYAAKNREGVLQEKVKRFVGAEIVSAGCFVLSGVFLADKDLRIYGVALLLSGIAALIWMKR